MIYKAVDELFSKDNILLICHIRPDGDTIGSAFALYHALKQFGKNVCVACSSEITPKFFFITGGKSHLDVLFEPDYIVAVDSGDVSLLGSKMSMYADKIDLVIDHHPTNIGYGKLNIINSKKGATGEIVYEFLIAAEADITPEIAKCLYTSISTDTGCFRYSSTTSNTLRCAADLIDFGADNDDLNQRLFEMKTMQQFELEKMAFDNLRFYRNETIAAMVISLEMVRQTGATDDDTDGLSVLPRKIEGVEVSFSLRETATGTYRISARSDGKIDVSEICASFGGGGHFRAAGCNMNGIAEDIIKQLVQKTLEAYENLEENQQ